MSRYDPDMLGSPRVRRRTYARTEDREGGLDDGISNTVHFLPKSVFATSISSQRCRIVLALVCLGVPAPALAESDLPRVTISGGASDVDHSYNWTISHEHTSPVVYVEFPHYRASLFFAPEGWTTKSTFLVNVGVEDRPGVCTAEAGSPASGIAAGAVANFKMQVVRRGTSPGTGAVLVRFADGAEVKVSGAELPVRESLSDKFMALYALGAGFLLWVVIREVRNRKGKASLQTDLPSEES